MNYTGFEIVEHRQTVMWKWEAETFSLNLIFEMIPAKFYTIKSWYVKILSKTHIIHLFRIILAELWH